MSVHISDVPLALHRAFSTSVMKLSMAYPSANEEVDPTTHCYTVRLQLWHQPVCTASSCLFTRFGAWITSPRVIFMVSLVNNKVLMNEEEHFHKSMIPLKKFSGMSLIWLCCSCHTDACGQSMNVRLGSVVLITQMKVESQSLSLMLTPRDDSRLHEGSMYEGHQCMSQFTAPQLPFMAFGGGSGSNHGEMVQPQLLTLGYQHTGSVYGMMPADPHANKLCILIRHPSPTKA